MSRPALTKGQAKALALRWQSEVLFSDVTQADHFVHEIDADNYGHEFTDEWREAADDLVRVELEALIKKREADWMNYRGDMPRKKRRGS